MWGVAGTCGVFPANPASGVAHQDARVADEVMIVLAGAGAEVSLEDGRRLGFAEYGDPGGVPCFYFHFAPGSRLDPAVLFARCPAALAGIRPAKLNLIVGFHVAPMVYFWPSALVFLSKGTSSSID